MKINPIVVDLSHYQTITDWQAVKRAGIVGVIHKATEGTSSVDDKYAAHRAAAEKAGLLWGAYHFLRPGDIATQVKHFLSTAKPTSATLLALDHEDRAVPLADAKRFLALVRQTIDRDAILYSGFLIKEQLGDHVDTELAKIRLWHAQYGNTPVPQKTWAKPWLWQFTGDGHGPLPHTVAGIAGTGLDIDSYDGTPDQLRREWSGVPVAVPLPPDIQPVGDENGDPVRIPPPAEKPVVAPAAQKAAGGAIGGAAAVAVAVQQGVPWVWIVLGVAVVAAAVVGFVILKNRKG